MFLQCKNCSRIFSPGIVLGPGVNATFEGCKASCPYCNSTVNIPDGTFRATVEGFVKILKQSEDPLTQAKELLNVLEKSKSTNDLVQIKKSEKFSRFSKWFPDTPEKIAAYIAIVATVLQLLMQKANIDIEYNQNFISQYNEEINIYSDKK